MRTAIIKNKIGLHARPAAVFCTEARKYESEITIGLGGEHYNAKSLMMIMSAGVEHGDVVEIIATGVDQDEAEEALALLLESMKED
jgi:phosphocarrier protein